MTDPGGAISARREIWIALLILVTVTLAVYSTSLFNGFVVDDEFIIVNNPQTLSLKSIPDVLLAPDLIKPYYRPLNRATYLLDYRIAGMNPAWYHGINIIIHLGNVLLVYLLCRRLLPDWRSALVAALIFGVHPINSEAVNFISARNTLLAFFFSLASFLVFMDAREKGKSIPVFSALLFFCGLLSKETAFMLIVVYFLYLFVQLTGHEEKQSVKGRLFLLLPYIIAIVVYFALRAYSLHGVIGTTVPAKGLFIRLAQNFYIIPQYFGLLLFPTDLTIFHNVPMGGLITPLWYYPVWLALLIAVAFILRSRNKIAFFGLFWFAVNYLPVSNIVPIPSDPMAERFIYMSAIGFFIVLGLVFSWMLSQAGNNAMVWGGTTIVLIACISVTVHRNLDWKDNLTLYSSGVRNNPLSAQAHYNLGTALRDNGDLSAAQREWESALKVEPAHSDSLTQMGTLSAMHGDLQKAEQYYIAALKAPPGYADPEKAMVHYNLGKLYDKQQHPQEALRHYEQFLMLVSQYYEEYKPDVERRVAFLRRTMPGDSRR